MRPMTLALALAFLLPGAARAQLVTGVVTPSVQVPGQNVFLMLTNVSGQQLDLPTSCAIDQVRRGSPAGPVVYAPFCANVITAFPAGSFYNDSWNGTDNLGNLVPPDLYYLRVSYFTPGLGALRREWFVADLRAGEPVLSAPQPPTAGQPFSMSLDAAALPGASYFVAFAGAVGVGQDLGVVRLALDADPLFSLTTSFALTPPFTNLWGNLDATGSASGIGLSTLPNLPQLADLQLHVQALVLTGNGPTVSNVLSLAVQ